MSVLSPLRPALLLAAIAAAAAAPAAFGADAAPAPVKAAAPAAPSGFSDRLFLAFFPDANLVPSQWWEGQVEYANGNKDVPVDIFLVRGVVAFHPIKKLEVGGRVGFGDSNSSDPYHGTGATDLDAYAKWVFPDAASNTDFAAGVRVTIPTGDDTAGLGFNSFSTQAFGSMRYRFDEVALGGHVGIRYNGDGAYRGEPDLDGKTSLELGFSALFPLANQVSLVGEAQIETDRFEGVDADTQVLVGINWRAFGRGMLRGAVAAGLTNGAPDFRLILGYAYTF